MFGPHLLHVLQDHIAMSVERFYPGQELAVVSDGDQDLVVASYGGLENRQRPRIELVFFKLGNLVLPARI